MTTSIHDVLDQLRSASYDERDKGDRFERLMQAYLQADPTYKQLYSDVWMWTDYPGRNGRGDTGVDLVAKARDTGDLTAIQCKFYDPSHVLQKPDIDKYLATSSKAEFSARLFISTTDRWGKNAEEAIEGQQPPVARLRVQDLDDSPVDWSQYALAQPGLVALKPKKKLRPHQLSAIEDVRRGFETLDRGKLIMACGTGKTFTALKLMEEMVPKGGTALFLVPSISLLSQTLKEWTVESGVPLRSFAVCSDVKVGKRQSDEDISVFDLAYPATTNTPKLVQKFSEIPDDFDGITVIFSTYQSIEVVARAQDDGLPEFDLIVCDEAHRTTGVTLAGAEDSSFVRVHDQKFIQGKKRLYMTATPRIYADASKTKAEEAGALLTSMDNEKDYGPELHRLGFGQAVGEGLLADYKVLVLAVDESYVSKRFQRLLSDENNELTLDDAAKIVGCWNGLAKRSLTPDEFQLDPEPMRRAVAFARNIKESKKIADMFQQVVDAEIDALDEDSADLLRCKVKHVDGTFNVLRRNEKLDWLKEDTEEGNCRILSNAKCLTEGVDVPALDAVLFLNPRDSVVDVVQAVGRVMRKFEGKQYGYVILPIGVPSDVEPEVALADNNKYKVVWQVLQALRAHDERFDAMVNKIDLNKDTEGKVSILGVGGKTKDGDDDYGQVTLDFPNLGEWRDAILAKTVQKVGQRRYWENWATDVSEIARHHVTRIKVLVDGSDETLRDAFQNFVKGLQDNLNPSITEREAIETLSQHLITKPVFDALFEGYTFSESNPVSLVMQDMVNALEGQQLQKETKKLDSFYDSVRLRARGITNAEGKQKIVKELYEKFFSNAFPDTRDRLGIVYTPTEIVDFIIKSADEALKNEFGASLSDRGVHVLDPFTGTGTFIVRLLQLGLIKPEDLAYKYRYELHANEIVLLAYYVAAINIEEAFHDLDGGDYVPFEGIVLTDTFQMSEGADELDDAGIFPENNERVVLQNRSDIRVIIGNPPYSAGQESANDNNQNLKYEDLDDSIRTSYAARSSTSLKNSLYDSYIRAFRWASNRIGDKGIVSFVSNGSFLDSNAADGMRKTLVDEFSSLYIFNLRGNQRTSGEQSRKEGGKIFGSGSRATIAISLLIKNPDAPKNGRIHYQDIGDYLSREQKLQIISDAGSYRNVPWQEIIPNDSGDWINHRTEAFEKFLPLGSKTLQSGTIFELFSSGVQTHRDAWACNFSTDALEANMSRMIDFYNLQVARVQGNPNQRSEDVASNDASKISWTQNLRRDLEKGRRGEFNSSRVVSCMYRPFTREWLYFDRQFIWSGYRMPKIHPDSAHGSLMIAVTGPGTSAPFSALLIDSVSSYDLLPKAQCFPLHYYAEASPQENQLFRFDDEDRFVKKDGISDSTLHRFQSAYGDLQIQKEDIFFYIYGVLSCPEYRTRFSADLRKTLARVPLVTKFWDFSVAGRELGKLHLNYEEVTPWGLRESRSDGASYRVEKMKFAGKVRAWDKSTIIYNSEITLSEIPLEAYEYEVNGRSALEWIMERYRVATDKSSGITNDPNKWSEEQGNPRYLVELIARMVTVSVETMRITKALPALNLLEESTS